MSNRAVFLDRDGTIIEPYDYLTDLRQVQLMSAAPAAMRLLRDRGFLLVMITNQSAVARGMLTEKKLLEIHDHLKQLLAEKGAYLDQMYYCPYHPEGAVERYRRDSELRKPAPGMLLLAARELDIDLAQSWVVGDDDRDIEAGRSAGCRTILLENRGSPLVRRGAAQPDFQAVNLKEAANLIVRYAEVPASPPRMVPPEPVFPAERSEPQPPVPVPPAEPQEEPEAFEAADPAEENMPESMERMGKNPSEEEEAILSESVRSQEIARRKARIKTVHGSEEAAKKMKPKDPAGNESADTRVLLSEILRELKHQNRQHGFTEFSIPKLMAGLVQMIVLLCLILAFWFGSGAETRRELVQICLTLAMVFQTMTLTFLIMHKP